MTKVCCFVHVPALALVVLVACEGAPRGNGTERGSTNVSPAAQVRRLTIASPPPLLVSRGVTVKAGGYGSAVAVATDSPMTFYLLTDRGPNVDTKRRDEKLFPVPSFSPHIGVFQIDGDSLRRIRVVEPATAGGPKLTGLPNPAGFGGTGESAVGPGGARLALDPRGIDAEGLARMPDGSFWISDEYGPHIIHTDSAGRVLEWLNPFGTGAGSRRLPRVLARRRPNRGMEGLSVTPDGATLAGIMQSPLDNPSEKAGRSSMASRILILDIATGATRQYAYMAEVPGTHNSAIASLGATTFLVLERDAEFPGDPRRRQRGIKRVYKIELAGATDISDPADGKAGRRFDGRTLEELTPLDFDGAGITPVTKTLVLDLLSLPGGYPHDKSEGLAVIGDRTLVIANDDDFGVEDDGKGGFEAKRLPSTGAVDRGTVYLVSLRSPLR